MTLQLKKNLKDKLNLDFLLLYQEPIIKGGGGIKDKRKFKPQVTALFLYGSLPFYAIQIACVSGVRKGKGREEGNVCKEVIKPQVTHFPFTGLCLFM